jgi:hypothetical protein
MSYLPPFPRSRRPFRTQNNTGRRGASCAEAEDDYPSDEEANYVVVAGGADGGGGADAYDDDADAEDAEDDADDDDGRPKQHRGLTLRLKTRMPSRGGAHASSAGADDGWEPSIPPLPPGWTRSEVPRKTVEGSDVYYRAPCGTLLRSMPEVAKWLGWNREAYPDVSIDDFSFLKSAAYGGKQPAGGRKPGCVACVALRVCGVRGRVWCMMCAAGVLMCCLRASLRCSLLRSVTDKLRRIAAGEEDDDAPGGGGGGGFGGGAPQAPGAGVKAAEAAAEARRWAEAHERLPAPLRAVAPLLRALMAQESADLFSSPVDAARVPDYHAKIVEPMDLGTIRRRLLTGRYARGGRDALVGDIRRTFTNALSYNAAGSEVAECADELLAMFNRQLTALEAAEAEAAEAVAMRRYVSARRGVALAAPRGWDGSIGGGAAGDAADAGAPAASTPDGAPDAATRAAACAAAAQLRPPRFPAPGDSDATSDSEVPPVAGPPPRIRLPSKRRRNRGGGGARRRGRGGFADSDGSEEEEEEEEGSDEEESGEEMEE